MKLMTFLFVVTIVSASGKGYSQADKFTLIYEDVTLIRILSEIENNSDYIFLFNEKTIDVNKSVNVNVTEGSIETVLDQVMTEAEISYKIFGRQILIYRPLINRINLNFLKVNGSEKSTGRQRAVSGTVKDESGAPIIGATIMIKGTSAGTVTDINGNFTLQNVPQGAILTVTYIGMASQEIAYTGSPRLDIVLQEGVLALDEVVVVGYGSQQKATVTGAVAAIENKGLLQTPVANLSNAMVGRVSGLLTTQASGAPGYDENTIRIRGVGTFTGNSAPLIMVDGIEAQTFNNIDPNEIESISILKDASATAVYGVKGANGVLLITTKRGSAGKPQISFTSQTAISTVAEPRTYMRSPEWAKGHTEATAYDSYVAGTFNPKYTEEDIQKYRDQSDPLFYPDINWVDWVLKPHTSQSQYNFNISGGQQLVKYFISLGYLNQGGLFNGDIYDTGYDEEIGYNRFNFRSNFDFDITKRLKAKVNFSSQVEHFKGNPSPSGSASNYGNYLVKLYTAPPNISPGVWDGKIVNLSTQAGQFYQNPLNRFFGLPFQRSNSNYLTGMIRVDYEMDFITKGLSAHGTLSYQNRNSASETISKTLVEYLVFPIEGGTYGMGPQQDEGPFGFSESTSFNRREDLEVGLNYNRKFGNHTFTGLLLYNQSKSYPGSLGIPVGTQGLVGRVTYNYKRRYMAEYNFGYNGTENFAPGKRFGYFPAYSLGWVVSEEPFYPDNKIITYLKLRGSFGEVGNDRIGGARFLYNPSAYTYGGVSNYAFGIWGLDKLNYTGAGEGTLGNPSLTWERAKKLDVGADINIGKSIRASIDYFKENRDNILANPGTVPFVVGTNFPAFNFGKMDNWGFDGEIGFNSKVGELNYWLKYIFTFTDNKIIYRDEPMRAYAYLMETGQRNGQYFGLLEQGYYNTWDEVIEAYRPASSYNSNKIQPGDFKYKDINGDGIINNDDFIPIGYSSFPGRSFGFSFGGEYKGFDLSVLFQAASNYSHAATKTFMRGWPDGNGSTLSFIYDEAWTYEKYLSGAEINMPRLGINHQYLHNFSRNTRWVENSSYVRLKNIEIGYSLPSGLLKKVGLGSARIYVNGYNLLTFSKLHPGEDPETPTWNDSDNEPYPLMKTFNGGINIKF